MLHGRRVGVRDINQSIPTHLACEQAGRPFNSAFPGLKFINQLGNIYESNYNELQATLTERSFHGLSFLLGYSYSHALDQSSDNRAPQAMDSTNVWKDYATLTSDTG